MKGESVKMKVTIGVSNHHVHVTKEDFEILFGKEVSLEKIKDLNQPGQFACSQKVDIKTEKGQLKGLRILGPFRSYTQVELSQTDCRGLKITAPVRTSGQLEGATSVEIIGPCGSIVREAAIIADRHIHITREDREKYGLMNVSSVRVAIASEKGGIFDHVMIKEAPNSYFEMHIDTDDANGFLIENGQEGEILL